MERKCNQEPVDPQTLNINANVKIDSSESQLEQDRILDTEAIVDAIDASFEQAHKIEEKVTERIARRMPSINRAIKIADKAFAHFLPSRVSAKIRRDATYLGKNDSLKEAQKEIIERDIATISDPDSNIKSGFHANLSKDEVSELGLDDRPEALVDTLTPKAFQPFFDRKVQRVELNAGSLLMTDCKLKKETYEIMKEITNGGGGEPVPPVVPSPGDGNGEEPNLDTDKLIEDKVALQMEHVTSPETAVKYDHNGVLAEQDKQRRSIDDKQYFTITGGPADVTAYHDFYDLQIAFEHIWTELFDRELAEKGRLLYEELVKIEEYGVNYDNNTVINSVEDLRQLKNDLLKARMKIAEEDKRFNDVKRFIPAITLIQWSRADENTRQALHDLYKLDSREEPSSRREKYYEQAEKIISALKENKTRVENFLEDLEDRLSESYVFDIFAAGSTIEKDPIEGNVKVNAQSINFGILVNYRQEWKPINYQVGDLVSTIPLAPKEVRRYSTKRIVKKSRAVKEVENSLQIRKDGSTDTSRVHDEIVRRANNTTSFKHSARGGVDFKVWDAKGSHDIAVNSKKQSSQTKKGFREAVLTAAEEYKNENKLEINTTSAEEFEETTSGEISNPNDEIPVTYLFYELQRRYEVREKLHKITPVVLVAYEVPRPDEIDEDWLLAHDWILRRVILDDSYLLALDYLSENFVGEEIGIEILRNSWETQLGVVEKVSQQVSSHAKTLDKVRMTMEEAIDNYAASLTRESEGWIEKGVHRIFGFDDDDTAEEMRVKMEAAKEAFQRAERQEQELRSRLAGEVTALEDATDKYAQAVQDQFNRRTEILRLRAHVKDNIIYYMQAIWDHEPPDQRFFRLYNIEVPDLSGYTVKPIKHGQNKFTFKITPTVSDKTKKLVQLADLDNPLGYKGNYAIFPLKQNNSITMYMMQDYIDIEEIAKLRDPDYIGGYTIEELKEFLKCMYQKNRELFGEDHEFFEQLQGKYWDLIFRKLADPYKEKEEVIVPTDSLYIEALPGKHPILEDFKLVHRAVDVKKVQAEVRHDELENVRLAARVLNEEYEDPDIEKKILIEGIASDLNVDPE